MHKIDPAAKVSDAINLLYCRWGYSSALFTLACLIWLAWRVGTNPMRITYPCQRVALSQVILYLTVTAPPAVVALGGIITWVRARRYWRAALVLLAAVVLFGGVAAYQGVRESRLRALGSGTIAASASLSAVPAYPVYDGSTSIYGNQTIVSFNHDPSIEYGTACPYDSGDNPAYDFVWETVETLGLGNSTSPLASLVSPGDSVLIKPNWVDFGPAVYTRPQVVRPLVDKAIAAGATEVYIGDGGVGVSGTQYVADSGNFTAMVDELKLRHPGITIDTVVLNDLDHGWRWVSLGNESSFAGSGYSHYDLASGGGATLYGHTYYSTADPQGVNPGGDTLGWYAVSDRLLEADVIINVPKLKTHQSMIATMSIKNLVGCTLGSTYDEEGGDNLVRIAHRKTTGGPNAFENDIFWRAILDVNKVVRYADGDGVLQPTPQREYLTVLDGIQAMERSQHHIWGGGLPYYRHVVLASTDPVALDAVACRVMGYDFAEIPSIANASSDTLHPVGTNDPSQIAVLGDAIDSTLDHVFQFNPSWALFAGNLTVTDFAPPEIEGVVRLGNNTIVAEISDCHTAYVLYKENGTDAIVRMEGNGTAYSAALPETASECWVLAQDEHFNTAWGSPVEAGDANGDGDINMQDVTYTELIILGYMDPTEGADANGDGDVNMGDVTTIELMILGYL
jgi:uncharacterized protein (DUF362 family)